MKKNLLGIMAVVGLVAASGYFVTSAYAKPQGETKPGWGYGDKNHVHVGPPGQSVRP